MFYTHLAEAEKGIKCKLDMVWINGMSPSTCQLILSVCLHRHKLFMVVKEN